MKSQKEINMKVIFNKILPLPGHFAMTFAKWIFVREENKCLIGTRSWNRMLNHESIHEQQILDFTPYYFPEWLKYTIGCLLFYPFYVIEWLIKLIPTLIKNKNINHSVSFEQEAYANEYDWQYLSKRNKFAWVKYIFKV